MSEDDPLAAAYERALALEKAGDIDAAAAGYREVLNLDPDDHGGASVRLAALGRGDAPERAPLAYVVSLFDQHAEVFDAVLVDRLGYDVPEQVRVALERHGPRRFDRALDLGCGSGLAGEALRDLADHITGVDASPLMIEVAGEKEVYDAIFVGDILRFLDEPPDDAPWDLIVATDVVPYFGALERLFAGVAARLAAGGIFAFSTETLPEATLAGRDIMVGPHRRFVHAEAHVREALAVNGLSVARFAPITVRHEEGKPVPGHLVLGTGPVAVSPGRTRHTRQPARRHSAQRPRARRRA